MVDSMRDKLEFDVVYSNDLETEKFERLFNDKSQSYKFYWLEAILDLLPTGREEFTFEELIEVMICNAWTTVTYYKLRLGPTVNGNAENFLEHATKALYECMGKPQKSVNKNDVMASIKKNEAIIHNDKMRLAKYVPYKLLSPFFTDEALREGADYIKNDKHKVLIDYMKAIPDEKILYRIIDGRGLNKRIILSHIWVQFIRDNYSVIKDWIQYNKAMFLEDRNPGVPGIVYKIDVEKDSDRKTEKVRDLWKTAAEVTGKPIIEIYTDDQIGIKQLSMDHFVPRSYIANDEMWNLIPMRKNKNSEKNNKLPDWKRFFTPFCQYQFYLYSLIFPISGETNVYLRDKFEKCRKDNLKSIWAADNLYIPGNSEQAFKKILEHNMAPIYEAAKLQGFETWVIKKDQRTHSR
jgi:hypothetical protein